MMLEFLEPEFSICKMGHPLSPIMDSEFLFYGRTDGEVSLVCPTADVPSDALRRDDGWSAFRVSGTMDLSLIGVLSGITKVLAENGIGVFVISTFDTDYILVRKGNAERTIDVLSRAGYIWSEESG